MKRQNGDRDIVFSAVQYRHTGLYFHDEGKLTRHGKPGEQTLEALGPFHLYRINPDGTGMIRLTHNAHRDHTQPRWSPDGRSLLFVCRVNSKTNTRKVAESVCRMDSEGHHLQTLFALPAHGDDSIGECSWSPDGKFVAIIVLVDKGGFSPEACLLIVDAVTGRRRQKISNVYQAAWDATGHYLGLADWYGNTPRLLDFSTGRQIPLNYSGKALRHLSFLPGINEFIGDLPLSLNRDAYNGRSQRFAFDANSTPVASGPPIKWHTVNAYKTDEGNREGDDSSADWFSDEGRSYFPLPALGPNALLAEAYHARSDGGERNVFRADLKKRKAWLLHRGGLIAVSPDGRYCAVAMDDWTGPYKRGGRRSGPLEVISTDLPMGSKAKKGRLLTSPLMAFAGGDWR